MTRITFIALLAAAVLSMRYEAEGRLRIEAQQETQMQGDGGDRAEAVELQVWDLGKGEWKREEICLDKNQADERLKAKRTRASASASFPFTND